MLFFPRTTPTPDVRPRRSWRAWLLLSALLAAVGCSPPVPDGDRRAIVQRLIEDEPSSFLDRTSLLEVVPVEAWTFADAKDLETWKHAGFDQRFEMTDKGLFLRSTKRRPRLRRAVDWPAESIDAVIVETPGFDNGISRLYWAREGEKLDQERSVPGRLDESTQPISVTFDVVFHPEWRGQIERIAVELFSPLHEEFRLRSVSGIRYQPAVDAVAAAREQPWKVELDDEVRDGLLALPESPIVQELEIPRAAALRLGFGTETGSRQAIVFSADLESEGQTTSLLEATVEPAESGRWHDHELDLAAFAGSEATLRLTARAADGEHDLVHAFAFWAHPEVLARSRDSEAPNVVVISIDTLRPDHLPFYGYERPTAPFLDQWAKRRATIFSQVVAPSPWTIPSHVSMFTGLDALRHGINHPQPIPESLPMMAELFRGAGYATMAITGGGFMHPKRGFVQGFERYRYWPDPKSEDELEVGVNHALEWIDEVSDRPFLMFFHTFEVHSPFRRRQPHYTELVGEGTGLPEEIYLGLQNIQLGAEDGFLLSKEYYWKTKWQARKRSPFTDVEHQELIDRYDSGIAYADALLARLLERLEAPDLERRTLVIVTSDHGEGFGEQGLAGHAYLYDWNLLVPLLIATPDAERRSSDAAAPRIDTQVRTIDLLPTITELTGLETPTGIDGVSLVPLLEGESTDHPRTAWSAVSFSNRGLALRFDNRLKYVFNHTAWKPLHGAERLYDLRRDPQELQDLGSDSREAEALRQQVRSRLFDATAALEVRMINNSDQSFGGQLTGGPMHFAMVKAAELPDGALTWQSAEGTDFRVHPGDDFRIWLERTHGRLGIVGGFEPAFESDGGSETFDSHLEVANFEGSLSLSYEEGVWVERQAAEPSAGGEIPTTGIVVSWRGGRGPAAEASGGDSQLTEQLRALGYLP